MSETCSSINYVLKDNTEYLYEDWSQLRRAPFYSSDVSLSGLPLTSRALLTRQGRDSR